MEDLLAQMVIPAVVRQLNAVARTRQIDREDLADRRRRTVGHHQHPIREQHRFINVVGDHDDGGIELLLDMHHRVLEVGAGQRIQGAEGLIKQQHFRLHRQRPGDTHPLLHAAGDLPGTFVQRMTHLYARQVVFDPLPALTLAHGATEHLIHRQRHIVETAQPRQQRVVLENHRPLRPGTGDFPVITQ